MKEKKSNKIIVYLVVQKTKYHIREDIILHIDLAIRSSRFIADSQIAKRRDNTDVKN